MWKAPLLLTLAVVTDVAPAQQSLGDLNPFTTDPDSAPGRFATIGSSVVFAATTATSGRELWGLPLGGVPQLLADVSPGSSDPEHLTFVGNQLFFVADDGAGRGLFVFDVATFALRKLRVLAVRAEVSGRAAFALGAQLMLIADDGVRGPELWRSDGTVAGTQLVTEFEPGTGGGLLVGATRLGSDLVFALRTPQVSPVRTLLVRTDGTALGTQVITRSDQGGPEIRGELVTAGAQVYFAGSVGAVPDYELWGSDGTATNTRLVVDWDPGAGSFVGNLIALGNRVAYVARIPSYGEEPVLSDGTPLGSRIVDVQVLVGRGSAPNHLTAMGGDVYLFAVGLPGSGLYRIDTFQLSASLVAPVQWQPALHPPIVAAGSRVFFRALDANAVGRTAAQVWVSDGTVAGTQALRDLRRGLVDPRFDWLTAVGNAVVFAADDGMVGLEPWQSDGSVAGTRVAANVHGSAATQGAGSSPTFFLPARAAAVFDADDGQRGREPWRTDGTVAGTLPLAELVPGAGGSRLVPLGGSQGEALFASVPGGSLRADYYASDGTAAGTRRLVTVSLLGEPVASTVVADRDAGVLAFAARLDPFGSSPLDWTLARFAGAGVTSLANLPLGASPRDLTLVAGVPFFAATTPGTGTELWIHGRMPQPILDIRPGPTGSAPGASLRIELGGALVFSAEDGVHGNELWRSDGSVVGTRLLADLWPGAASGNPRAPAAFGDRVLFAADAPTSGAELWQSDGTTAGTVLLADLRPGPAGSDPRDLVATPTVAYFSADDGVAGRELFVFDGAGTRRVLDVNPGPAASNPHDLVPLGTRRLLFVADDGSEGDELWLTDGTVAGTRRLGIRPGPAGSGVDAVTVRHDGRVLFAADDGVLGAEPWSFDAGAVAQRIAPGCGVATTTLRTTDPVLGTTIRFDVDRRGGGILGGLLLLGRPSFAAFAGCTIHADLGGVALPIAFQNGWSTLVAVPNVPSLSRTELRAQAVLGPFAAPPGWSLSEAWALRVGN